MRKIRTSAFIVACALGMAAFAAHAEDRTWHLVGTDASGAFAYAEPGPGQIMIAFRPVSSSDMGGTAYSGMVASVKYDCATMKEWAQWASLYDANHVLIQKLEIPENWNAIDTGGEAGPDDLMTAKCAGKALPDQGSYTGDEVGALGWLKGEIVKSQPGT